MLRHSASSGSRQSGLPAPMPTRPDCSPPVPRECYRNQFVAQLHINRGGKGLSTQRMTKEEFSRYYPHLYHMAEPGSWDSIRKLGLLSTSALLDFCGIVGEERRRIESQRRAKAVLLPCKKHGTIVIRDQKPISDSALQKCLTGGVTPAEWYATLNRKVFFWVTEKRLNRMLEAYGRSEGNTVLILDATKLLARPSVSITLSSINTGCARRRAALRGRETFCSLKDYPFDEVKKKRHGVANAVAELAVDWCLPEIEDLVIQVEQRRF
jgi:hypothetical protein